MKSFLEETGNITVFHFTFPYYLMRRRWNTLDGEEWRADTEYLWEAVIDPLQGDYIQKWALGAGSTKQECLNSLLISVSNILLYQ